MTGLRKERTRQSRELLLRAAAELFAEKGYHSTSLVDVADRSGVSRGSIPSHFGDKLGLLRAVVEQLHSDIAESMTTPLAPGAGGARGISHLGRTSIRRHTTKLFLALLHEASDPDSPIHTSFAQIHADMRDYLHAWLARPEISTELPPGVAPGDLACAIVGAIIGINQQWSLNPKAVNVAAAYDAFVRTLFNSLDWAGSDEAEPANA
ncbi:TetR/AcrR family transcriptional regulator [Amycolatopsis pithecellobii]|uniref:TetR family transcriptional regulator n=1 Tax=Amycolatopsis pithecellobii TaxID=664692 RepID=A0A6N7YK57_9PSEU|nr:TetR/AcrR family transcriptional regulator [Amycolatopsis pithecellobii]MTD53285.1 TetR family transcriptional regulator [Amycolatopsis pithecellobii]